MKQYYNQGGLGVMMPQAPAPQVASYYTYGVLPPEIWPITNTPPLTQAQEDAESDMLGEPEERYAQGGIAENGPLGVLYAGGGSPDVEGPVQGPGTGRSDEIDARLSPG